MQNIESIEKVDELINNSDNSPVIFFKHSITCPISARAYTKVFEALDNKIIPEDLVYIIVVQDNQDISSHIAEKIGIIHESPQIILIKDKQPVYSASHDSINIDEIVKILND